MRSTAQTGPAPEPSVAIEDAEKQVFCRCQYAFRNRHSWFSTFRFGSLPLSPRHLPVWPVRCTLGCIKAKGRACVKVKIPVAERRRWPRLALAIPVFVRGKADPDRDFLEFATALNVSAGGMLLAVRRLLDSDLDVSLEIPSAPLAALPSLPAAARVLNATVLRTQHAQAYNLVGIKFSHPLEDPWPRTRTSRRKQTSLV